MKCKVLFVCTVGEDVSEGVEVFKGLIELKEQAINLKYSIGRSDFVSLEGVEQEKGHYILKLTESTLFKRLEMGIHRFSNAGLLVGIYDGMYLDGRCINGFVKIDMKE
jgi:hypothetical protein